MSSYSCCSSSNEKPTKIEALSIHLKLISETNRLKLLHTLHKAEHCVCELMNHFKMSQSLISHHLRDLKNAGIVINKKKGLRVYYSLTNKGKRITNLVFKNSIL